jgi:threonine synthase
MATRQLLATGWLHREQSVLLLNTGSGQKYMENVAGRAAR